MGHMDKFILRSRGFWAMLAPVLGIAATQFGLPGEALDHLNNAAGGAFAIAGAVAYGFHAFKPDGATVRLTPRIEMKGTYIIPFFILALGFGGLPYLTGCGTVGQAICKQLTMAQAAQQFVCNGARGIMADPAVDDPICYNAFMTAYYGGKLSCAVGRKLDADKAANSGKLDGASETGTE